MIPRFLKRKTVEAIRQDILTPKTLWIGAATLFVSFVLPFWLICLKVLGVL